MNNEELIDVKTLRPFRRFIYTIGELPSSYLMSMTYEEQLIWFCNYLEKTVIPALNNNGLAVEELQAKYVELKGYVDNYFDNLDVQEEINNKLDEMADSGELENLIGQYIQLATTYVYNNVNEMINADNLVNGSFARTSGFYTYNDGGGANYKIRTITNEDTVDNKKIFALVNDNTLIAELLPLDHITPQMLGANCDGETDDSAYVLEAFNIARDKSITLLLNKIYYINDDITLDGDEKIVNINQESGYFIIDKSILIYDITNSKINLILNGGGSGDKDDCSVTFEKCIECDFNLKSNNVNQTAFYMHHYSGSLSRCTAIVKGSNNVRTLLHQSVDGEAQGHFFGTYLDIEDRLPEYPIHFELCNDITINHIENLFWDETYLKNSVEFIWVGSVHIGTLALGGLCKNLLYVNNTKITIEDCLFVNENHETNPPQVTAIFCKNNPTVNIGTLRNVRCLYSLDCSEILYTRTVTVKKIILEGEGSIEPKGIYFTNYASEGNYLLNFDDLHKIDNSITFSSSYGTIQARGYKKDGIVYVNGYILITTDCPANTALFSINTSDKCQAKDRVDFVAVRNGTGFAMHFASGSNGPLCDSQITASQYQPFTFNFSYPTKHFDSL